MKIIIYFLVFFYSTLLFAQQDNDTIFFNKDWKKCSANEAIYFRLMEKEGEKLFVKDFYRNGVLQMKGEVLNTCTKDSIFYHGKATFYHPNGKKSCEGNFKNNKANGTWTWYTEKGRFKSTETYYEENYIPYEKTSWAPQNQSSWFIANVGYRYKLNKGTINSGHGLSIEVGVNFGYFISQKLILAPIVGIGFRDVFYNTSFSNNYINDFNSSLDMSQLSHNDSLVVNEYKGMVNSKGFLHERLSYFGIMLKLPYKYAPIVKVYKGGISHSYKTGAEVLRLDPPPTPKQNRTDNDYFDIIKQLNYGVEVYLYSGPSRVKEYSSQEFKLDNSPKKCYHLNFASLSVYFECIDASKASFGYDDGIHSATVPFSNVLSSDFVKKYKTEYNIGVRLSFGLF